MKSAELPITGYLDRLSRRPGERFAAHVSLRDGGEYRARLVRVVCADPNPDGPGMRLDDLSSVFDRTLPGRRQAIHLGSCAIVDNGPRRDPQAACSWTVLVWAQAWDDAATVLSEADGDTRLAIRAGHGGASAELRWPGGGVALAIAVPLHVRRWYRLTLGADPATGRVRLVQQALDGTAEQSEAQADGLLLPDQGRVMFAAEGVPAARHFTGRLEAAQIVAGFADPHGAVLAAWDFSQGIGSQTIADTGPQHCHGRLVNTPTRAVAGARWSGQEMCWRHAPQDYGAIHFHQGDLGDVGWEVDFDWAVPADLPSGAYALHLTCAAGEDFLPLYVLPRKSGPFTKIVFLASTFTYQAYFNHARAATDAAFRARVAEWGAYPYNPDDYPLYGRSTYNKHSDGSGIATTTRLRPTLTMRPGFLTFNDPHGSGLRHYPADTHLLAWLEAKGMGFDIVTDEDLDEEGAALLAPYTTVLTGSHPEYHTLNTLDALRTYTGSGGNLAYLGGNGFYWRVARSPDLPGMIELRRAEGGIRTWAAEPGEYYHQLDGQYGGLWRRNRRPPQMLAGVGFSAQGRFEGTYYRRMPASYTPEFAWMFDGIDAEIIGDHGLSGGGAAGFELDRADVALGTPPDAAILARSENPPASFMVVPEEMLSSLSINGETPQALMRGEIVYFDTESGGAVFAVGSITFLGSLWRDGAFDGPISRLLENVVRRFSRQ